MIRRKARRGAIFGVPCLIGLVSIAGLLIGLLGDGGFDVLCAAALAVPVAVIGWSLARARGGGWDGAG